MYSSRDSLCLAFSFPLNTPSLGINGPLVTTPIECIPCGIFNLLWCNPDYTIRPKQALLTGSLQVPYGSILLPEFTSCLPTPQAFPLVENRAEKDLSVVESHLSVDPVSLLGPLPSDVPVSLLGLLPPLIHA